MTLGTMALSINTPTLTTHIIIVLRRMTHSIMAFSLQETQHDTQLVPFSIMTLNIVTFSITRKIRHSVSSDNSNTINVLSTLVCFSQYTIVMHC